MGKNVFLTGAAGTGKTHVLNRYIRWLRERGVEPAVTASTGIAATHIGGQTIHSWSGIGIKDYLSPYDLDRLEQAEKLVKRVSEPHVLIVDEVSMLSNNTLGLVDQVLRVLRRCAEPFGGMQVVVCGDFFQLPPVVRGSNDTPFAFIGEVWNSLNLHVCYLDEQYRQSDDHLLTILNAVRSGDMTAELGTALEERAGIIAPPEIPHLYTHNVDVDRLNTERLTALEGTMYRFDMVTKGSKKNIALLMKGILAHEVLQLKEGAAVMFVKNHPQGLYVNGTLGTVVGVEHGVPVVQTLDGDTIEAEPAAWQLEDGEKVIAEVRQVPLRLAWAVTVHKSQGMTLDAALIDLGKTFVPGQGYVALSRIRDMSGVYLVGLNRMVFERHPDVAETDEQFLAASARITRRLEQTPPGRLEELHKAFEERIGAKEPDPTRLEKKPVEKVSTIEKTRRLVAEQTPFEGIIATRGMTGGTIVGHIEKLLEQKQLSQSDITYLQEDIQSPEALKEIHKAFKKKKTDKLAPVHRALQGKYSYDELRFARLFCTS